MSFLKYIFAALLIAVVWGLWWFLKLPIWIAIVSTIVIIVILAALLLLIRRRKKSSFSRSFRK